MKVWIEEAQDSLKPIIASLGLAYSDQKTMSDCCALSAMTWVGMIDDDLACIWGVVPPSLMSSQAYLWLYTTPLVDQHQFIFIRHSQRVLEELLKEYPTIVGHMDVRNASAKRWLSWLGAQFGEPEGLRVGFWIRKRHG